MRRRLQREVAKANAEQEERERQWLLRVQLMKQEQLPWYIDEYAPCGLEGGSAQDSAISFRL